MMEQVSITRARAAWLFAGVAVVFAALAVAPTVADAANPSKTQYSVRDVGNFSSQAELQHGEPPQGSGAFGLNNNGDVVGWSYYYPTDGSQYALLFTQSNGRLLSLGALPGGGGWTSHAYAINDAGVVVGGSAANPGNGPFQPFVWQNGVMTALFADLPACEINTHGACSGSANDINSAGQIVGRRYVEVSSAGGWTIHDGAFLYSGGATIDLDGVDAAAINDRGTVAGTSRTGHAAVFAGSVTYDLGTLGGTTSSARDISGNGNVVVGVSKVGNDSHAFIYTDGQMRDLGTLGGSFSEATAVNKKGTIIVGNSTTANGEMHGFVYSAGKMVDLNDLIPPGVGTLIEAQDVNDHGQIAGRMAFVGGAANAAVLSPARK